MKLSFQSLFSIVLATGLVSTSVGQSNYDEAKVPKFKLPDPLVLQDGTPVKEAQTWTDRRRGEVLKLFADQMYGNTPTKRLEIKHQVVEMTDNALAGKATRKQILFQFTDRPDGPRMEMLVYLPKNAKGPVPVFVGLNFGGNQTIHGDPEIRVNPHTKSKTRGSSAGRWQADLVVQRGYGVATIYYGDIDPDRNDFSNGVHPLFYEPGQSRPKPDQWGAIGAWAWGLSRAMDYFETDDTIDQSKVTVLGHSRLGKTSLWAGARDARFAIVISNNSGCGGAALSRRRFGETVKRINTSFPHWFCDNFKKYNGNEDELPMDQHMLVALMAPRPVYVASAELDRWADPRGEFQSLKHALPVYRLLGAAELNAQELPAVNQPLHGAVGYHIRTGKHNVTKYDWQQYLDFADRHFGKK